MVVPEETAEKVVGPLLVVIISVDTMGTTEIPVL
jgi:hypothetical protein